MTTSAVDSPGRTRRTIYIVVGVVVLVLAVIGLISFHSGKETAEAEAKADQLSAALGAAGAPVPSKEQIVRVLGDDGGAVCDNPNSALKKATLYGQLTNGAAGPGIRPVIADTRVVQGELLVLKIYCPDQLPEFRELVGSLKLADLLRG
jgi:Tfp pilus assembly protein FimT